MKENLSKVLIGDTASKSLKSPPRSPNTRAKSTQEVVDFNEIDIEKESDEIEYEESLRYFEYSRDQVKAYWFLPLKRIHEHQGNELRVLESLNEPFLNYFVSLKAFPFQHKIAGSGD